MSRSFYLCLVLCRTRILKTSNLFRNATGTRSIKCKYIYTRYTRCDTRKVLHSMIKRNNKYMKNLLVVTNECIYGYHEFTYLPSYIVDVTFALLFIYFKASRYTQTVWISVVVYYVVFAALKLRKIFTSESTICFTK